MLNQPGKFIEQFEGTQIDLKCRIKATAASWKTVFLLVIFSTNSWWLQQSESFWFIIFGDLLLICLGVYWHEGEKLNFIPTEILPSCLFAESLRDIFYC